MRESCLILSDDGRESGPWGLALLWELLEHMSTSSRACVECTFHTKMTLLPMSPYIFSSLLFLNVLYGCETFCLALREEGRLRVFENRIQSRTFGHKRDENGEWRRLHNEDVFNVCIVYLI